MKKVASGRERVLAVVCVAAAYGWSGEASGQGEFGPVVGTGLNVPAFRVVSVEPAPEALAVSETAVVRVTFNLPVHPLSLGPEALGAMGRFSGPVAGQYTLSNNNRTVHFARSRPFSNGETVFVSVTRNLRSIAGTRLAAPHVSAFWVRAEAGDFDLTRVDTLTAGVTPYGAHGGDLDDDGDLDLAIPNEDSADVSVFLNIGNDTFQGPVNYAVGFHCSPSEGQDFNGDGIVDLATSNILANSVSVLIGNGDGTYLPQVAYAVGSQPRGLTAIDLEGDGDVDLVTANRVSSNLSILENRGDGTFEAARTLEAGVNGETGVTAGDFNRDGLSDLVVIGYSSNNIAVMLGDGAGNFVFHAAGATGAGPWMVAAGDVNGDGMLDVIVAESNNSSVGVLRGDGTGVLGQRASYAAGSFPIAVDLGDIDGDGDLDMTASAFSSRRFTLYRNNGAGVFAEAARYGTAGAGSCTVLHDRDGDGDVDMTAIDEIADEIHLYQQ